MYFNMKYLFYIFFSIDNVIYDILDKIMFISNEYCDIILVPYDISIPYDVVNLELFE